MTTSFNPENAVAHYACCNAATLRWMLQRPALQGGFLNTKCNAISLVDYEDADGLRGPNFTYGWIQGRGLEALATHAAYFDGHDPALAQALDQAAQTLYQRLKQLRAEDGHIYFCYDQTMRPVLEMDNNGIVPQDRPADIFTYSDAFAAKGLIAAAARFALAELPDHLSYLRQIVIAIEERRFQMSERVPLSKANLADQSDDFAPRMILLGACHMLDAIGKPGEAQFGAGFLDQILTNHHDVKRQVLRNVPGQDACNVGHGIECVGFALSSAALSADTALVNTLTDVLVGSFKAGFDETGIVLSVDAENGETLNPLRPWWCLPETIRAAALAYKLTGREDVLKVWAAADEAFFNFFWRDDAPLAYQTRDAAAPIDYVPATPDLDPGYHTGLSLLAAINARAAPPSQTLEVDNGRC